MTVTKTKTRGEVDVLRGLRHQLQVRRRAFGISQRGLAERMDVSQSYVSDLERGYVHSPGLNMIVRWATALDARVRIDIIAGRVRVEIAGSRVTLWARDLPTLRRRWGTR